MKRLSLLLALVVASTALAQGETRRPPPRGEVTGVELGLEGSLAATRGGTLRWLVSTHDVLGLDRLRPAPGATLTVLTPWSRTGPAAELTTDALGRARVELPIPADAPTAFVAAIRVTTAANVTRRFEVPVEVVSAYRLTLDAVRAEVHPGGRVRLHGRLTRDDSAPPRTERVEIRAMSEARLVFHATVRPDESGAFSVEFAMPHEAVALNVSATHRQQLADGETVEVVASTEIGVATARAEPMIVEVIPSSPLARPGERIAVEVIVRTHEGVPVPNATLTAQFPWMTEAGEWTTDARGHRTIEWTAPPIDEDAELSLDVNVVRTGLGSASGSGRIVISRRRHRFAVAIEGGALPTFVAGRIFVRAADASAVPLGEGQEVRISGPRVAAMAQRTDASGMVSFDVALRPKVDGDACGGDAATELLLEAGDGHDETTSHHVCVPLDPDAVARVRPTAFEVDAGGTVEVEVDRAAVIRNAPVVVALLAARGDGESVDAIDLATLPAGQSHASLRVPANVSGRLLVRARALFGPHQTEVRGGTSAVFARRSADLSVVPSAQSSGHVSLAFEGGPGDRSAFVAALPIDEARRLVDSLRETASPETRATLLLRAAELAARTGVDGAAPAVLRGGEVVAVRAAPNQVGVLRDPFRTRDRFLEGRLGLLFRAIETQVEGALPSRLANVAVRQANGRYVFNRELVATVPQETLGDGGATGLGGEPLTIADLERLDPTFSYDAVARRITRKRLFALLLGLRGFVAERGLDLPWTWSGEPSAWLEQLVGRGSPLGTIDGSTLVDGWGRPFALRPGRARFDQLAPVPGFELVSSGADARFGTSDDQWSPIARVLPEGSLYGRAVGEDALVARLAGVELGRATIAASMYTGLPVNDVSVPVPEGSDPLSAQSLWPLPVPIERDPGEGALRRPSVVTDGAFAGPLLANGGTLEVPLPLDSEPRTWGIVAWVYSAAGASPALGFTTVRGGGDLLVTGALPQRLRRDEPVTLPLTVANLGNEARTLSIHVEGLAPGTARVEVPAQEARVVAVPLAAQRTGTFDVAVVFEGATPYALRRTVEVDTGALPIRRRAAALVAGSFEVDLEIPSGAGQSEARLLLIPPSALARDPQLADVAENDPALVAWSTALSGRGIGRAARARLLGAQHGQGTFDGAVPRLSTAAAITALSALGNDDADAASARERAVYALVTNAYEPVPRYDDSGELVAPPPPSTDANAESAAVLLALAPTGVPDAGSTDRLSAFLATTRSGLRSVLRTHRDDPALLARAAAALLVADPQDRHGRAMFDLALAQTDEVDAGRLVRIEEGDLLARVSSSLALAIAAHQLGREGVAAELARAAAVHDSTIARAGGEGVFLWLAAGAYGAFGRDARVVLHDTGSAEGREGALDDLHVVPFALPPGDDTEVEVETEGPGVVLARVEASFAAPFEAREDGPLTLRMDGDAGRASDVGAFELTVRASEAVRAPTLDVQLPAGVDSNRVLAALRQDPGVVAAVAREPGILRVQLTHFEAAGERSLSLPIPWTVYGELHGLGVAAYPGTDPAAMSVLPPRALHVAAPAP